MSLALLQSALLLPVELTINQLLALDTASHAQLAALAGNTLAIELQQPAFTLFVSVHADRLRLSPRHEGTVTATLIGSPTALAGLLLRRQPLTTLQGTGVELLGSTGFVLALQKFLDHVQKRDKVWICKRIDIARHWKVQHPFIPTSQP